MDRLAAEIEGSVSSGHDPFLSKREDAETILLLGNHPFND